MARRHPGCPTREDPVKRDKEENICLSIRWFITLEIYPTLDERFLLDYTHTPQVRELPVPVSSGEAIYSTERQKIN